jgi:hypothetical protein
MDFLRWRVWKISETLGKIGGKENGLKMHNIKRKAKGKRQKRRGKPAGEGS